MFILNKIVLSVLLSVCTTQSIKAIMAWIKSKKFRVKYLFIDAGMPSSHTATVTSLFTATYITEGFTTLTIALFVIGAVVIKDVLGDKIFADNIQNVVNEVKKEIKKGKFQPTKLNHLTGHTIKEVVVGLFIALAITFAIFYLIP